MTITLLQADITTLDIPCIVNAANSSLLGGGGVDGAIHRRGGPRILEECRAIRARQGGCLTCEAVITSGGNLPADYVIHTVGPVWIGGTDHEPELLANCYRHSLHLARENGLRRIAFPNISTGVYGYPKEKAAAVAIATVREFADADWLDEVVFVCYDGENYRIYEGLL